MTFPIRKFVNVACWLFLLIAAFNAVLLYRSYLAFEKFTGEFGYSCNPCYDYGGESVRFILLAAAMGLLMLMGKKGRPLRFIGSFFFAVMVFQSFLAFRFVFDSVGYFQFGDAFWQLGLVGSALLVVLGLVGGTGLLFRMFGGLADSK